jgi:glycosyltransferase involved in cell wall biosynthesis
MKPLFFISCPIDTYSGYGARSRDIVKALLKSDKYDIKILPQRWGSTPFGFLQADNPEHKQILDCIWNQPQLPKQPEVWMQITVPNEFQAIGKFNIGVTAGIETTICDASWIEGCNRMDLNLVSSDHSKKVFQNSVFEQKNQNGQTIGKVELKKPVEILFEGVDLDKYFKSENLKDFDIYDDIDKIKENFCYLFVGHWLQGDFGEDRKNVGYLIKAFLEVFKNKANKPALILKTSQGAPSILDKERILKKIEDIRKTVAGTDLPNIYLIHGDLYDEDINCLYNHPKVKAMISLTKGEGFGRPLLEFSVIGKPIIASGWSGHIDFLSPEFAGLVGGTLTNVHISAHVPNMLLQESQWFKPDDNQTGHALTDVFVNYKNYTEKAKRLAYKNKQNFSFDKMTEKLDELLKTYIPEFPKQVEIKLPKLKKIN